MRDQDGVGAFLLGDVGPQGGEGVPLELEEGVLSEGEHEGLRGLVVCLDGVLDGGRGTALAVKDDGGELDIEVDLFLPGDFTGIAGVHGGVGSGILLLAGGGAHRSGKDEGCENVVDVAFIVWF